MSSNVLSGRGVFESGEGTAFAEPGYRTRDGSGGIPRKAPAIHIAFTHLLLSIALAGFAGTAPAAAETISSALARAYIGNPDLNQQRASTRATDETVARAKSLYRPQVTGTGSVGFNYTNLRLGSSTAAASSIAGATGTAATAAATTSAANNSSVGALDSETFPSTASLTVTQNIFNGNRSANGVRQAESQVMQSREQTRNTEQNTLQNGATAYMNVLRDTAILELNKNNITVLEEQLRQTRDRFNVGEVTRTDVAQSESSLATARSNYFTAQANLQTSIANFRQIIGEEPHRLEAARPIDALLPPTLDTAITVALGEHPNIQAAFHNVDAAQLQVQLNEAQLYPTLNIVGNVQAANAYEGYPAGKLFNGSILGQLSIPIYTGGDTYASVRQAKELLAQARLQADLQRDMVRANVVSTWGQLESAKAVIRSSQAAVKSSEIALDGVREEAKVGQRTTLDVLNAQQTLLQSRVNLVSAQRDRVVASYTVLASVGRLSAANLGLSVIQYDPTIHFQQVKDKWIGLRTPDGR